MPTWNELPTEKTVMIPSQWRQSERKADAIFAQRAPHLDAGERATRIYIAGIIATLDEAGRHERRRAGDLDPSAESAGDIEVIINGC
jgi:hypothetical protein